MPDATYSFHVDFDGDNQFDDGELSGELVSTTITRGFSNPLARMATAGRAVFVIQNVDKSHSPPLAAGRVPMRQVRFRMTSGGNTSTLFRGFLENIRSVPAPSGPPKTLALECVDAIALLDMHEGAIPLQFNAQAHEIVSAIISSVYSAPGTNYENGINSFPTSGERWSGLRSGMTLMPRMAGPQEVINASGKLTDTAVSDWGRFFIDGQGRPTFHNRHHQLLNTTPRLTLVNQMHGMDYALEAMAIINDVEIQYSPRVIGGRGEVLGSLSPGRAIAIDGNSSEQFTLRYADPANSEVRVGGYQLVIPLQSGTDFMVTSDEAGEGNNENGSVSINVDGHADQAEITVTNNVNRTVYLQKLQIRGRAVRVRRPETARAFDGTSINTYRRRVAALTAPLMNSHAQAQRLAEHLIDQHSEPRDMVTGVRIYANRNSTFLNAVRQMELGDRVRITEDHLGLSNFDSVVYHMEHRIEHPGYHELVIAVHEPYSVSGTPFRIGVSQFNQNHELVF